MTQRNMLFNKPFTVDPNKGFLPQEIPTSRLPASPLNDKITMLTRSIPQLLQQKSVRTTVDQLDCHFSDVLIEVHDKQQKQYALLMLTLIAQAYVRETPQQPVNTLPITLSRNIHYLCQMQQRPLTLTYCDYVLHNWKLNDERRPITLENITPILTLTGSTEEEWFIKIHIAVEAACGKALYAAQQACLLKYPDEKTLLQLLQEMADSLTEATQLFKRMKEGCSTDFFWDILRPYFEGWDQIRNITATDETTCGVKLNGVSEKYYQYAGVSGAQSTVTFAIDNALGITHATETSQHKFLAYMPRAHLHFASQLQKYNIATRATDSPTLQNAWDNARKKLQLFRLGHLGLVETYINHHRKNEKAKFSLGTGGTKLGEYLEERLENTITARAKL